MLKKDKQEYEKAQRACELICGDCLRYDDECAGYNKQCNFECPVKDVYRANKERYEYLRDR